jgi:hypothetical protein
MSASVLRELWELAEALSLSGYQDMVLLEPFMDRRLTDSMHVFVSENDNSESSLDVKVKDDCKHDRCRL